MLSYSLSFLFLYFFGAALLAQWAYDLADGFLILCVVCQTLPVEMTLVYFNPLISAPLLPGLLKTE